MMKSDRTFRTTDRVFSKEGFILPGTAGEKLFAVGENAWQCRFADVEIETGTGTKKVTVTTTVLDKQMR